MCQCIFESVPVCLCLCVCVFLSLCLCVSAPARVTVCLRASTMGGYNSGQAILTLVTISFNECTEFPVVTGSRSGLLVGQLHK